MDYREEQKKAVDFLYDFLNRHIRLNDIQNTNVPTEVKKISIQLKKDELMGSNAVFRRAVSVLTNILMEQKDKQ